MPTAKIHKSEFALLLANQFIWGSSWVAIKYVQLQMGPVVMILWSLGISVIALYPFVRKALAAERKRRTPGEYFDYAMMGIVGVTGMALLYAWGTNRTLAANGALISTAVPVLTAILAAIILRERLTVVRVISLVIALAGVFSLSDIGEAKFDFSNGQLPGILMLLGGTAANALYVVYSKKLLGESDPILLLFWGQLIGFIGALPFLSIEGFQFADVARYTAVTWLSLLFLGVVFYALTMVVFFKILVNLEAGQIMVASYLQPVFGVLMAAMILHEKITLRMMFSGVLVFIATVLATYGESWRLKHDSLGSAPKREVSPH